jgi:flavodoxin
MLVAYFSWGGNVRRIAEELHGRVGGEIFEIVPVRPYSSDYDECVGEAEAERRAGVRVELKALLDAETMLRHRTVFVGYPNWLQGIPRPVGAFLEAYDWTGKIVMPFCSHGGGRLGQTEAQLARLCPKAKILKSLAVFKNGGGSLSDEIDDWLDRFDWREAGPGV